jgi:hypothetical protein
MVFSRTGGPGTLGVGEGGLFMPRAEGTLRNKRISAVIYCRRVFHENAVHVTMNVYHHPGTERPLDPMLFDGLAQCWTTIRKTEIEVRWDHDRDSKMVTLKG